MVSDRSFVAVARRLDPELRGTAGALEDPAALQQLTLDIVICRRVVDRPHLLPSVAVPMEKADLFAGKHAGHPPLRVFNARFGIPTLQVRSASGQCYGYVASTEDRNR